jgi:hypothetical protein
MTLGTILLLIAFVCFVLAAFNATVKKVNLLALGLALWALSLLLDALKIRLG